MPRMYVKTHHMWPNHPDEYELTRRTTTGDFERMVIADNDVPVMDALAIEVTNEMLGAEAAVDADWDTVQHTEEWVEA